MAALVASGAPLRLALARIAARVIAVRAWETLGYVRCADYARERPGMSARELLDLAAVDGRLRELPRIEAAFASGAITWTKLRLLSCVATPADEAGWLDIAARTSAARLAREVRALDRAAAGALVDPPAPPDEPSDALEMVHIRCGREVLASWWRITSLARRVSGAHVSPADAAEAVAAEVVSALPLEVDPESLPLSEHVRRQLRDAAYAPVLPPPGPAGQPAPFTAALLDGLDAASPRELDARLRRAARLERGLLARLGPLLLELASDRGWADLGCRSFDQYVRERLGFSPRKARALLRVERACACSTELRRAWKDGSLSWCQAQVLARIVLVDHSRPWHAAWVARARGVTLRRLEDDVDCALESGDLDPSALPAVPEGLHNGAQPENVPSSPIAPPHPTAVKFVAPVDVARFFLAALATVRMRLEAERGAPATPGQALEAMLEHAEQTWWLRHGGLPREQRIMQRDGWRCTIPGCTSYANLHAHHIVFRSQGGSDAPENLTTLCAAHHHRGVHGSGGIRISGRAPDRLRFEMPLEAFSAGDVRLTATLMGLYSSFRRLTRSTLKEVL